MTRDGELHLATRLHGSWKREAFNLVQFERGIVLVRWLGIIPAAIALPFLGIPHLILMYSVVTFAVAYNLFLQFVVFPHHPDWLARFSILMATCDIVMASAAVFATGGIRSDFFVAYFLIVVMAALRFGGIAVAGTTAVAVLVYSGVVLWLGVSSVPYAVAEILLRMGFVAATGVFVGYVGDKGRQVEREAQRELVALTSHLNDSTALLSRSLEVGDVLTAAVSQCQVLSGADLVVIDPWAQGPEVLPPAAGVQLTPGFAFAPETLLRQEGTRDVLTRLQQLARSAWGGSDGSRERFRLIHCTTDDRLAHLWGTGLNLPFTLMLMPLLHGDRRLGDLYFVYFSEPEDARRDAINDVLTVFVSRVATTLTNAFVLVQSKTLAITDPVTGLYNHRYFYEVLQRELLAAQENGRPLSLLVIDVDSFKSFNDTYGHSVGDVTLRAVADIIRSVVPFPELAARFGGDEFTVILPGLNALAAVDLAEDIRRRTLDLSNVGIFEPLSFLSISVGAATAEADDVTPDQLFNLADEALVAAKQEGKNRVKSASVRSVATGRQVVTRQSRAPSLDDVRSQLVSALLVGLEAKHPALRHHGENVSRLAAAFGEELGLGPKAVERLRISGALLDVGILNLPDDSVPLASDTPEEDGTYAHARGGAALLERMPLLADCVPGVLHHHTRYDGGGHPFQLSGDAIPLEARMLALCDAFDRLTLPWPEQAGMGPRQALTHMRSELGTRFDPRLWGAFQKLVQGRQSPLVRAVPGLGEDDRGAAGRI